MEELDDVTSYQGSSPSDKKRGVNLELILEHLGRRGRYQITQLMLNIFSSFLYAVPLMQYVFVGYQPDYHCSHLDNVTQVAAYLPDDVTNFTLQDVQYGKCNIDVTVNTSGTPSIHSLPCVAGVNFSMPSHTSFLTELSLVCDQKGMAELAQSGLFGGEVLGCLMASVLADRYGRKKIYVSCALCTLVSLIITSLVPGYHLYLIGRICVGFFTVGMIGGGYTMFMELLPRDWRPVSSMLDTSMWVCGSLFLAVVAYCMQGVSWRYLSLAYASVFLYSLILPWFLDESLRWVVATGNIKEAEKILEKACRMNGKDFSRIKAMLHEQVYSSGRLLHQDGSDPNQKNGEEIDGGEATQNQGRKTIELGEGQTGGATAAEEIGEICAERTVIGVNGNDLCDNSPGYDGRTTTVGNPSAPQAEVFSARYTVLDLFRYRVVFVPFLVTVFVWMTSNMFYYVTMFGSVTLSGNRFLNFSLLSLQNIPSSIVALLLMQRIDRRPLAFAFGFGTGCSLLVSVGLATLGEGEVTSILGTVAQYVGMFFLSGSYILLFVFYMEIFPTGMRVAGTGAAATIIKFSDMGIPFLMVWANETPWAPGVLLGCLCCLASFSIWLLPETRHRKLPDTIQEIQAWKKNND